MKTKQKYEKMRLADESRPRKMGNLANIFSQRKKRINKCPYIKKCEIINGKKCKINPNSCVIKNDADEFITNKLRIYGEMGKV